MNITDADQGRIALDRRGNAWKISKPDHPTYFYPYLGTCHETGLELEVAGNGKFYERGDSQFDLVRWQDATPVEQFKFSKLAPTPACKSDGTFMFWDVRIADESGDPLHVLASVHRNDNPFDHHPKITDADAGRYATLFAIAPELLEALKVIAETPVGSMANDSEALRHMHNFMVGVARQAIAKAEGKP